MGRKDINMLIDNSRGSEWKKYDLHMHSTASDGQATPHQLVDAAVEKGIAVIAITDHHTVDALDDAKAYGKEKGIVVVSGIEFRTEYGRKSVHMIGLFPDSFEGQELNQAALNDLILAPLGLSRTQIVMKARETHPEYSENQAYHEGLLLVQVDFRRAADLIHKYGGIVTVHAGGKANSFDEEMRHEGTGPKNVDLADSLGTVKEELLRKFIDICEVRNSREVEFYLRTWNKPCIAASDAHKIGEFARNFCWIKGEPTFEGIRQIIYEPESRVKIQDEEPEEKPDYLVIDRIEIDHKDFGKQEIPFNQGLNTIIGGRSSGKSILLGCIAKLCGTNRVVKTNKEDYDKYIAEISHSSKLYWRDGGTDTERKIDYFPQGYIIEMASKNKEIKKLVEEILSEDIDTYEALTLVRGKLATDKVLIHQLFSDYQKQQQNLEELQDKQISFGNREGITHEIKKYEERIEAIKIVMSEGLSKEESAEYESLKEEASHLKEKNKIIESSLQQVFLIGQEKLFDIIGISFDGVSDENIRNKLQSEYAQLESEVQSKWRHITESISTEYNVIKGKNEQAIHTIEEREVYKRATRLYTENAKLYEENKKLEKEMWKLSNIDSLQAEISKLRNQVEDTLNNIIAKHIEYYITQRRFCDSHIMEIGDVRIDPKVSFQHAEFIQQASRYFDGRSVKNSEVLNYQYKQEEYETFITTVLHKALTEEYVLKGNANKINVIEDILSTNPFNIEYDISYQGDELKQMSEGKTAFVILKMLLEFGKNEYPILIDQPEDDLDNRAIFGDLVKYLRGKKLKRQIILVTHNPNIVVGADAEEIIVANQEGIGNSNPGNVKFAYKCGALENSYKSDAAEVLLNQGIRQHVCELLEGGNEAFRLREKSIS